MISSKTINVWHTDAVARERLLTNTFLEAERTEAFAMLMVI